MKAKSTRTTLTANQLLLIIIATQQELRARLSRRHVFKHPIGDYPARPNYVREAYAAIRDLIAALRVLDRQYIAAANREFLQRERLAA